MSRNQGTNQLNRQQIKSNMLKEAARLWHINEAEIDSLDPLVTMLIEGCAVELEKVGHQIHSSNSRVLNRLAQLMTPDVIVGPQPAHAVVQVRSIEPQAEITPLLQMSYTKELPVRQQMETRSSIDLKFTPAAVYKVFDGKVAAQASSKELVETTNIVYRGNSVIPQSMRTIDGRTLYIGVELNETIKDLDGLSFFFDWKNYPNRKEVIRSLGDAQWYLGDVALTTVPYLEYKSAVAYNENMKELYELYDMARNHEKKINDYYGKQFITIKGFDSKEQISLNNMRTIPNELNLVYGQDEVEGIGEDLLWFKVVFPQSCPSDAMENVYCGINCIPIVNRELIESVHNLRHNINVVPLKTEDLFYQMVSVEDTQGNLYLPTSPLTRVTDYKAQTYSLRQGEVGRFDERNAFETLSYLVDLLRDEANAFSFLDRDWLNTEVDSLNKLLSRVELKLEDVYDKESISYVVVKPEQSGENALIRFYSTTGGFANNIPTGTNFDLREGIEINSGEIVLATKTKEGREKLEASRNLIAYKQAILTRNRIVTVADIKAYCHKQMAHKNLDLDKIEVQKGVGIGRGKKEGLIRTMEVNIYPKDSSALSPEDWEDFSIILEAELTEDSTITYPFNVNIMSQ